MNRLADKTSPYLLQHASRHRLRCRLEAVPGSPVRPFSPGHMNRLPSETSPYLLQHAFHPVT
jgi:uncharacterized protein YyaL (SSP411 family)